jgi:hypothetical protein
LPRAGWATEAHGPLECYRDFRQKYARATSQPFRRAAGVFATSTRATGARLKLCQAQAVGRFPAESYSLPIPSFPLQPLRPHNARTRARARDPSLGQVRCLANRACIAGLLPAAISSTRISSDELFPAVAANADTAATAAGCGRTDTLGMRGSPSITFPAETMRGDSDAVPLFLRRPVRSLACANICRAAIRCFCSCFLRKVKVGNPTHGLRIVQTARKEEEVGARACCPTERT